jgi:uncharacterized SAM-dependent methyltransferase
MFVGSSSEAKNLIRALSLNLKGEPVDVHNWGTTRWELSGSTLKSIEEKLEKADFAAFILAADDVAVIRGEELQVPRDNVLFELGMSFGLLGRERTFVLAPEGVRIPSDLAGIKLVRYELAAGKIKHTAAENRKAMDDPGSELLEVIDELGCRVHGGADGVLQRGSTSRIELIVDGALDVSESRDAYARELRQAVLQGEKVPAKFQFAEADGGRHWLSLCRGDSYPYFAHAKTHLRNNAARLVERIHAATGSAAVDLVSLGCGDGTKDEILLRALADKLTNHECIYYYPVDISDILLVEAVRHVAHHGPNKARYHCKAVLGDFTKLSSLRGVLDYRRPIANLFSVLGNVLGSFDEADILTSLGGAMEPGDLVLIEANIGKPEDSKAMLEDDAANQWDLSTLAALDIDPELCELKQETKSGLSVVDGTKTLVSYAVPSGGSRKKKRYTLSGLHHYDFDKLKAYLASELRVTLIEEISGSGVCLLLGRRDG